jgi:hypothetical protein
MLAQYVGSVCEIELGILVGRREFRDNMVPKRGADAFQKMEDTVG